MAYDGIPVKNEIFKDDKPVSNEEILLAMKQALCTAVGQATYKFDGVDDSKLRCPNEKEQKEWLKMILSYEHFHRKISTAQYRTIKGEIRKGHLEIVFNFLSKRGLEDIRERFNKYSTSKVIYDGKIQITFPRMAMIQSFDININKEVP